MTIYSLDVLLSQFGTSLLFPVQFCCFLTCILISQEAGQVVWYSHLFKNFPQFVMIHTVKGFGIVNKAEVDILELSRFFNDPTNVGNLISGASAFSKSSLNIWNFMVHALEKEMETHSSILAWRIPGMGEPGGLPSLGSHRVRHDWSDLAAAAAAVYIC